MPSHVHDAKSKNHHGKIMGAIIDSMQDASDNVVKWSKKNKTN